MYDKSPIDIDRGANIIIIRCFGKKQHQTAENQDGLCIEIHMLYTKHHS